MNNKSNKEVRESFRLINDDCLKAMGKLIAENIKVDAIITDPPYGTTACKWDSVIPFKKYVKIKNKTLYEDDAILYLCKRGYPYEKAFDYFKEYSQDGMWERLNKLIKPNGAIVLFGSEPFSSALRRSNIKNYKYDWKWDKVVGSNFVHAKQMPLKVYEDILVFNAKNVYHPQMTIRKKKNERNSGIKTGVNLVNVKFIQTNTKGKLKYPTNKIEINRLKGDLNSNNRLHPTQKPVALMEYLIKTYTNENELVLDFTMGSGTTGVACVNTDRNFIGIELDKGYFDIATERINEPQQQELF